MNQIIHRIAAGTKRARQMMARATAPIQGGRLTPDQVAHNARVEAARKLKKGKL